MDRSKRGKQPFRKPFARDEREGAPAPERRGFGGERGAAPARGNFARDERGGPPGRRPFVARDERGGAPGRKPFVAGERRPFAAGERRPFVAREHGAAPGRGNFSRDERGGPPGRKPFVAGERRGPPEARKFGRDERSAPGERRPFVARERAGAPGRKPFVPRDERGGPSQRKPFAAGERRPFVAGERGAASERKPFPTGVRRPFIPRERRESSGPKTFYGDEPGGAPQKPFFAGDRELPADREVGVVLESLPKPPRRTMPKTLVHWRAKEMGTARTGLARALSKLGYCSRKQAWDLIIAGRVTVNGVVALDGEHPVVLEWDELAVDGVPAMKQDKVYLALNKPRGLVTTANDEQGRPTVFECLGEFRVPHLSAVGRLDPASEGLLLFTNDHAWAAHLTSSERHVAKTYQVQVDRLVDEELAKKIQAGAVSEGEHLGARSVKVLRQSEKTCWLEIVLDEGRNRQIRRLLAAFELEVQRLIRVAIGNLQLGTLAKGAVRRLTFPEIKNLGPAPGAAVHRAPRTRPTERQLRRLF